MSGFANLLLTAECVLAFALVALFFFYSYSFEQYLIGIPTESRGAHNSEYLALRKKLALPLVLVFATCIVGRCTILYFGASGMLDDILILCVILCVVRGLICVRRENHAGY